MPNESVPEFDLYGELGVATSAGRGEIELAFRTLAKRHHPDTASDPELATARMKRLNLARAWLVDPARRAHYDSIRGVRHGPEVVLPPIDPLGAWPTDTAGRSGGYSGRPAAAASPLRNTIAMIAFMVLLSTIVLGFGSVAAFSAALISAVILLFFGLLWTLERLRPPRRD